MCFFEPRIEACLAAEGVRKPRMVPSDGVRDDLCNHAIVGLRRQPHRFLRAAVE